MSYPKYQKYRINGVVKFTTINGRIVGQVGERWLEELFWALELLNLDNPTRYKVAFAIGPKGDRVAISKA